MKVRTRFAPSPTGYLHVGGARTALYNWAYAKKMKGTFVLRIEDTDQERSNKKALELQLSDLENLGLNWDEGPHINGPYGPYKQSERLDIYSTYAQQLLKLGKAFYCFCSDEELQKKRQKALEEGRPPHYDGHCRHLDNAQKRLESGERAAIRLKVPEQKKIYTFKDLIRSEVTFSSDMVGDFIILRSDGMPVYNFCCAVDDALMKITHVLRSEEHLSNTLRQIIVFESLDFPLPEFGHFSLILGEDRQKLSKRHGATSCYEYLNEGFLPEAIKNYLSLLGWSHPDGMEIFCQNEFIEKFEFNRIISSPAIFDKEKLKWINSSHLRHLDHKNLWDRLLPFLAKISLPKDSKWIERSLTVFKTSMTTLKDAVELYQPLSDSFIIFKEGRDVLDWKLSKDVIKKWKEEIAQKKTSYLTESEFTEIQDSIKIKLKVKGKDLFMPIRVAVIGKPHGAELKQLVPLIKISDLILRANKCLE